MKSDLPPGGLLPFHHEAAVEPVNSNQLVMGALLDDLTVIDNKNLVGMAHGFQPVSNHDDRLIVGQFCNGLHELLFIFRVHIGCDMTPKCWTENPTFGGHIMSQISNEIRLEAVQRVVEDGMSISASARLAGVHKSMLQEWVMQYREHGAEGVIKQDRKQKKYTGEFKIEVVEYAHTNQLSAGAASAHFSLPTKSLFLKWERIYYEEGPQALLEEHRGRASKMGKNVGRKRKLPDQTKEDLIAEVQRLRMENEYLKKLQALVQKRIARENGNGSKSSMN